MEYILCAAIWYKQIPIKKEISGVLPKNCDVGLVISGHRHYQCMWIMSSLTGLRSVETEVGDYTQGFLTNQNRFVDREEAWIIAEKANQIKVQSGGLGILYSEDLY